MCGLLEILSALVAGPALLMGILALLAWASGDPHPFRHIWSDDG